MNELLSIARMLGNITVQTNTTLENPDEYTIAMVIECNDAAALINLVDCLECAGFLD